VPSVEWADKKLPVGVCRLRVVGIQESCPPLSPAFRLGKPCSLVCVVGALVGKDISISLCVILLGAMTEFLKKYFQKSTSILFFVTFSCFTLSKNVKGMFIHVALIHLKGGGERLCLKKNLLS
jgi:hypothetical protein